MPQVNLRSSIGCYKVKVSFYVEAVCGTLLIKKTVKLKASNE